METHVKNTFPPTKKLKIENSAISWVRIITSVGFFVLSWIGYVFAVISIICAIAIAIKVITGTKMCGQLIYIPVCLILALLIVLVSKLMAAASLEIEESKDNNMIFGVSAFFMAFMSLVVTLFTLVGVGQ